MHNFNFAYNNEGKIFQRRIWYITIFFYPPQDTTPRPLQLKDSQTLSQRQKYTKQFFKRQVKFLTNDQEHYQEQQELPGIPIAKYSQLASQLFQGSQTKQEQQELISCIFSIIFYFIFLRMKIIRSQFLLFLPKKIGNVVLIAITATQRFRNHEYAFINVFRKTTSNPVVAMVTEKQEQQEQGYSQVFLAGHFKTHLPERIDITAGKQVS